MCGIVGFISDVNNAIYNTKHGLKTLEYRGYDSAGIAYIQDCTISYVKSKGEVSNLFNKLDSKLKAKIAIGHTRWATHGEPNKTNAHPHKVKDIALVHNGIIENYKELSKGFNVISQTDTEVIAHIIANEKGTLIQRVQKTVSRLRGSYAIAVISSKEPDKIVLACKSSPLVIGVCKKGASLASDIYALIGHSTEAVIMKDDQTAVLSSGNIELFNTNNEPVKIERISIMQDMVGTLHHKDHDTYMHKEILEQPDVVSRCLINNRDVIDSTAEMLKRKKILLTACGTSYHACLMAQIAFEKLGLWCDVRLASELRYSNYKFSSNLIMIAVSQSGETADTLAAIKIAKKNRTKVISIINRVGSTMSRESDATICTFAGPEISVASTKSFTTQLIVLFALGIAISGKPIENFDMFTISELIKKVLSREDEIKIIAKAICNSNSMLFLGRDYGVPIAQEGALKLKEISYIHAEAYPAGELKHGPIALIHNGMPCVFITDKTNKIYNKVLSNLEEAKARNATIIAVSNESDTAIESIANHVIKIPDAHEMVTPFTASVALQLLAYHVAILNEKNVDKPRNLAKSVTVE